MRPSNVIAIAPLALLGCGLLTFTVDSKASTHIAGAGVLGQLLGALSFTGFTDFNVNVQQGLKNQGVSPGDVQEVHLTDFTLTANPGDLSFLTDFSVYISAPNVDEVLIASGNDFPAGESTVALDIPAEDLTDYVTAEKATFRVDANGSAPSQDTDVTAKFTVSITATAKGACRAVTADSSGS